MINLFYLAVEEAGGGFGISSDILGSNLINLLIVIGLLVIYGGKFVGNILTERRDRIAAEIKEAEERAKTAEAALAEAKENLNQAQAKAKQIKADAEVTAKTTREQILAQGQKEIERMKANAVQELDSERAKVINELKRTIAILALQKAEQELQECLNDDIQGKLISRAVEQLGG